MNGKKLSADICFTVQIICTMMFGGSQFVRLLSTTRGVSMSWLACSLVFFILNFILTIRAHKTLPSRVTRQAIVTYALWLAMYGADLGAFLWKRGSWDKLDTLTTIVVGVGIVLTLLVAHRHKTGFSDPMVKAFLAMSFMSSPQIFMAYKNCKEGGAGLAGITIVIGYVTVLTRIGQLIVSLREKGGDTNRIGSILSEIVNVTGWTVITVAWLMN